MKKIYNRKIRVIVTAVGGSAVGYHILESLKLVPNRYYIVATDMSAFAPGLYEADKAYIVPGAKEKGYIQTILKLAKKEKADVILPGSQPETMIIAKHEKTFLKYGIVPIVNPYNLIKECFDKDALALLLNKCNILTPCTVPIKSPQDVNILKFPIIIKPSKDSTGSKGVHIVKNYDEFERFFEELNMKKVDFLAQEYVGSEQEEYTVGTVVGWDGRIIDTIIMRRYITGVSKGEERIINGKSYVLSTGCSQGFFVNQPDVKECCENVCKKIGARGPVNIQIRRGKEGLYVFEVHPRFSGSALIRALVGFNESHVLIQEALGLKRYKTIPHKLGRMVMRKFGTVMVDTKMYDKMKIQRVR